MHESLLNLLSTLSRPGSKTSEHKIALGSILSLLILIGLEVARQWTEKSESHGATVVIVSSILALITASKWYADKRAETKGRLADMIANPEVTSLLRDALLPPSGPPVRPLNGAASPFAPVLPPPLKIQPRELRSVEPAAAFTVTEPPPGAPRGEVEARGGRRRHAARRPGGTA